MRADTSRDRRRKFHVETDQIPEAALDLLGQQNHLWVDTPLVERASEYLSADLFAGCGGFSSGFIAAGLYPVLAVENWAAAAASYRVNHPNVWLCDRDIDTLTEAEVLSGLGDERLHVLIGGRHVKPIPGRGAGTHRMRGPDSTSSS